MRRPIPILTGFLMLGFLVNPIDSSAQEMKLTLQGGLSYNVPLSDFAADDGDISTSYPTTGFAEPGYGFKFRAILNISPTIGLYAEYYKPEFNANLDAVLERLELPYAGDYDANWRMSIIAFGARITPIRIAMAAPYVQVGVGRYTTEIYQRFVNLETTEESDVLQGFSVGAGALLSIGNFGLDIGAQYHTVEFIFEGSPIGWKAGWFDVSALLSINLTP